MKKASCVWIARFCTGRAKLNEEVMLIEVVLGCGVLSRSSFNVHIWITNSCFMRLVKDHALFATQGFASEKGANVPPKMSTGFSPLHANLILACLTPIPQLRETVLHPIDSIIPTVTSLAISTQLFKQGGML
jgi:hypothetical protein